MPLLGHIKKENYKNNMVQIKNNISMNAARTIAATRYVQFSNYEIAQAFKSRKIKD